MRRSLAIAAFALAAVTATPVTAAGQPAPECDLFQNCLCGIVASAAYRTTGIDRLHCA